MQIDLSVQNVTKKFKDFVAVNNVSFEVPDGQFFSILGPSGCGKTTLLRMIAGLEPPTSGSIYFGEIDLTQLATRKRNIGMVFQYPVVYRGISVYKNIELPLLKRKIPQNERKQRIGIIRREPT